MALEANQIGVSHQVQFGAAKQPSENKKTVAIGAGAGAVVGAGLGATFLAKPALKSEKMTISGLRKLVEGLGEKAPEGLKTAAKTAQEGLRTAYTSVRQQVVEMKKTADNVVEKTIKGKGGVDKVVSALKPEKRSEMIAALAEKKKVVFDALQEHLPKARVKGAALWGAGLAAVGAGAGYIYNKMTAKKEQA